MHIHTFSKFYLYIFWLCIFVVNLCLTCPIWPQAKVMICGWTPVKLKRKMTTSLSCVSLQISPCWRKHEARQACCQHHCPAHPSSISLPSICWPGLWLQPIKTHWPRHYLHWPAGTKKRVTRTTSIRHQVELNTEVTGADSASHIPQLLLHLSVQAVCLYKLVSRAGAAEAPVSAPVHLKFFTPSSFTLNPPLLRK